MHTDQLFCSIRKTWVAATPEEMVRQSLIQMMLLELGFPPGGIALEKGLREMPHIEMIKGPIPARRADIIVFAKDIHPSYPYYPLLLIECKAVPLTEKVIRQVVGYNQFIKAHFIAVANQTEIKLGWYQPHLQNYSFISGLLPFSTLLKGEAAK
jgi:hypothetical protein